MKQFYLLDLIRGSAALLVVMGHLRSLMFESWNGGNIFKIIFYAVTSLGHQSVIVFFVLSGFLITYLLLVEEKQTKTISIKSFYMRRILRIWPLYYFIIFISFFFFSQIPFFNLGTWTDLIHNQFLVKVLFFVLFLQNAALMIFFFFSYAI